MTPIPREVMWMLAAVLVEAAVIDGWKLKVPNWLTYNLAGFGLAYAAWAGGAPGLLHATAGLATGLVLLLPLYAIGGMGAGDVKLLAGVGAWVGPALTLGAFAATVVCGGVIALGMVALSGQFTYHMVLMQSIGREILSVRDPAALSRAAAERKPRMMLLPYGIPMAIGSIGYFAWMGLLA